MRHKVNFKKIETNLQKFIFVFLFGPSFSAAIAKNRVVDSSRSKKKKRGALKAFV